jgi:hypothetical protein
MNLTVGRSRRLVEALRSPLTVLEHERHDALIYGLPEAEHWATDLEIPVTGALWIICSGL